MTEVLQQDGNSTGLRLVREVSPGALSGTDIWLGLEPNSYKNFGTVLTKVARAPINQNRQRRKGVVTDANNSGSFQCDLTYTNFQIIAESVFFADYRRKTELAVATVDGTTTHAYEPAAGGAGFKAGDLLMASGFASPVNNGLKVVSGTPGATSVPSSTGGLVDASTQTGEIVKVGHQFAATDAAILAADNSLNTTTFDMTSFGLNVGEWMFVGDDVTGNSFVSNEPFWGRAHSITAHKIIFDKTENALVDDAGTGKTIRLYFGRTLQNELATGLGIKKYTYQFERSLGYADDAQPTEIQGEYLKYGLFEQIDFTFNTANKLTFDAAVTTAGYEVRTSSEGLKPGSRPAIISGQAFNASSNVRRVAISVVGQALPLFAFLSDIAFTIKNNLTPNKAISKLGAFSLSAGEFQVSTASTAYFADVAAVTSMQNNDDCTIDAIVTVGQQAVIFDLPLVDVAAGSGLNVVANQPVTLATTSDAGTGVDINANSDYTMMMGFFDYIPLVAEGTGA